MKIIPGLNTKRQKYGTETLARNIFPKPSNGSPVSMTTSLPVTVSQKKRGRPLKADVEHKQREAIERGVIIPPTPVAAGHLGYDEFRSGNFAPICNCARTRAARNPQVLKAPSQVPSLLMSNESVTTSLRSGDFPGKKRKSRQSPKPKVSSSFKSEGAVPTLN
jgi:hypothetical protein